jgi:uncharacterized circularly permuted ATP-grasp superfamily protein
MKISIEYGIWGDSFSKQLRKQGFKFTDKEKQKFFTKANQEISFLHIHRLITDNEWKKILNRLHNRLKSSIVKVEE